MKKYTLQLNEIQANIMQRMFKEEIEQQRAWKEKEKAHSEIRDYICANMWELIEQLAKQNVDEYWLPSCMYMTEEEKEERKNVK